MCGICGIVNRASDARVSRDVLIDMRDVMTHRGPDDEGLYINENVGLGFRRLSIVDLASGHQPMANETGDVWLIFNGEIYNHADLRRELTLKGHLYKTKSDTESILHLYEEEGIDGFQKMNGMFGIAIWDDRKKRLVLVRDRLGIKPLYYSQTSNGFVFASEIKSILKSGMIKAKLNLRGLEEYFTFRFVAGEKTLFDGIYNLLPGHILILQDGKIQIRKFWDLPQAETLENADLDQTVDQLGELLNDSVRLRLMSDVPLGTFCSGGVDSSLVSAYAVKLSNLRLNTFSVGFQEASFDESHYAKMVSDKYETRHHQLVVDNRTFADSLPDLIWYNDEPLNHTNSIQIYHISKLAKEFVTVVLTGEGSDELFGGYPRYLIAKMYSMLFWAPPALKNMTRSLAGLFPMRRVNKLARSLPLSIRDVITLNAALVDRSLARSILLISEGDDFLETRIGLLAGLEIDRDNLMESLIRLDLKSYLVSILNRQDKMSMAASIESRVPFLDYRLVEWGARIPFRLKTDGLETKIIVKKLGERFLPRKVVYRRKSGFGVPVSEWLRDKNGMGKYLALFEEPRFRERGYLKTETVRGLAREHLSGKCDHGEILWELINLELWHRIFIENSL
jgi:asparagine synthase (glutamine-hydrolysing)